MARKSKGFSAFVDAVASADSTAQKELQRRIAALEHQIRALGAQPMGTDDLPSSSVSSFLIDCGLAQYAFAFQDEGYDDLETLFHIDEGHMKELGMLPGHALKLRRHLEMRRGGSSSVKLSPQGCLAGPTHEPGIYRCVHGPRVAIRSAPTSTAKILDTIHLDELVRISEVVGGVWARLDDDEVWARWTALWPRRPRGIIADDEDLDSDTSFDTEAPEFIPTHAFILIDGSEVGIPKLLLQRLPDSATEQVSWPFVRALEARCAEADVLHQRKIPSTIQKLRNRFVERALTYVGTPYHRSFHDPNSPKCQPGSDHINSSFFLDAMQMIQQVLDDLKEDFGFLLISNCKPVHCRMTLPIKLEDASDLEPGDLIFYEVASTDGAKRYFRHVEIFLGRESGMVSLGSMPWSSHSRTNGKDGVQVFDDFRIEVEGDWTDLRLHFHSIRTWLESDASSFVHGQLCLQKMKDSAARIELQ